MTCAEILARLPLREVARMVGVVTLPERNGPKFCSPLRPDRKPSCTIYRDESKGCDVMRDWSRGESLDAIAFFAAARGIENGEAHKQLAAHLGAGGGSSGRVKVAAATPRPDAPPPAAVTLPPLPKIDAAPDPLEKHGRPGVPEDADFEALRASRLLPEDTGGLELAHLHGALRFGIAYGFPCWLATDRTNRCAVARRLDGERFPAKGERGEEKALSLPGTTTKWPAGLITQADPETLRADRVPFVLVEGGPDLLAAYCILARFPADSKDVQPVAMLGSSASIPDEALPFFASRPGVILAHGDNAGHKAADRWGKQLQAASCRVTLRHLPEGKDLNDLIINRNPAMLAAWLTPPTK